MQESVLFGQVMHKRLFPKENGFKYGIYYLALPLAKIGQMRSNILFGVNAPRPMSFWNKDHGDRSGQDNTAWIKDVLKKYDFLDIIDSIMLISMPRVFGYVFNPVSFWMCYDYQKNLRAVLCEVNNTFGETHSYLCAHDDKRVITKDDILNGTKVFHVSPFLQREGEYAFRFAHEGNKIGIWIDLFAKDGRKQLITAISGRLEPMTYMALCRAFLFYPLVTLKAIFLIHYQAAKLWVKGIAYVPKPKQQTIRITSTSSERDDTYGDIQSR